MSAALAGQSSRARGPLSESERARILELHGQGMSRNRIAREVGRAGGTVSTVVAAAGGSFKRGPGVVAGTAAAQADAAERRTLLIGQLYDRAEAIMSRLSATDFKALAHRTDGRAVVTDVPADAAPGREVRHLVLAVTGLMQSAVKLEAVDGQANKNAGALSVLDRFDAAMKAAYGDQRDPDLS